MSMIVSFSGGKDSTALLLRLLELGEDVRAALFFDGGWEFPQMLEHVERVRQDIAPVPLITLRPIMSFDDWAVHRQQVSRKDRPELGVKKGEAYRTGAGWPSAFRRWCTARKVEALNRVAKTYPGCAQAVGIAADEPKRIEKERKGCVYPLVDWGWSERDCLEYCYSLGYRWGGLYRHFQRVSCFCCPLQRINDYRTLRREFPSLWQRMLDLDRRMGSANRGFVKTKTVADLDRRFAEENELLEVSV